MQSTPISSHTHLIDRSSDSRHKVYRILSNPLVDSSVDNSIVAENPQGHSEVEFNSDGTNTVALLYSNNFEAVRYKDYIERTADQWVVMDSFPFRTAQEVSSLIFKTKGIFDKIIIVLSHEFRGLLPECQSL
jgi:hypothetical protein